MCKGLLFIHKKKHHYLLFYLHAVRHTVIISSVHGSTGDGIHPAMGPSGRMTRCKTRSGGPTEGRLRPAGPDGPGAGGVMPCAAVSRETVVEGPREGAASPVRKGRIARAVRKDRAQPDGGLTEPPDADVPTRRTVSPRTGRTGRSLPRGWARVQPVRQRGLPRCRPEPEPGGGDPAGGRRKPVAGAGKPDGEIGRATFRQRLRRGGDPAWRSGASLPRQGPGARWVETRLSAGARPRGPGLSTGCRFSPWGRDGMVGWAGATPATCRCRERTTLSGRQVSFAGQKALGLRSVRA